MIDTIAFILVFLQQHVEVLFKLKAKISIIVPLEIVLLNSSDSSLLLLYKVQEWPLHFLHIMILLEKRDHTFEREPEGYMGVFGGRKGKEKLK